MRRVAFALCATFSLAAEQPEVDRQFWSEINLYWQFHPDARLVFMAQHSRDRDVDYEDVEFATYFDYYVRRFKPMLFQRLLERDQSRAKRIVLRAAYLASRSISKSPVIVEHRPYIQGTLRWAFPYELLMSSRNRGQFRFSNGAYSWRYRNELKLERDFNIYRVPATPYAAAEVFYDSKSGTVNRFRYSAGFVILVQHWMEVEPYFTRQSTSQVQPRNENALGITLHFYLLN